jgi:hypothetical protein
MGMDEYPIQRDRDRHMVSYINSFTMADIRVHPWLDFLS